MSASVEQIQPPTRFLSKSQCARVDREAPRYRFETKSEWLAAQWAAARRLYPSLVPA
ncbi:hypothetical protein SEA_SUNSHINE924_87 [Mycobacterium Phage Sunshine924]|nr:hypothetical protein SEA_SUNSHINE924_87 [Mycobacterium Phage Sunshine924]